MYIPVPYIHCAKCNKPVEHINVIVFNFEKSVRIDVKCHGEKDSMEVTLDEVMRNRSLEQQLRNGHGIAFMGPVSPMSPRKIQTVYPIEESSDTL